MSDQEAAPAANFSSSSLDEAIMPPPPITRDDSKQFQEHFKRVAASLDIPLQEMAESQHKLLDTLQMSTSSKISLPINNARVDLAKIIWQTPTVVPPTCKQAEKILRSF